MGWTSERGIRAMVRLLNLKTLERRKKKIMAMAGNDSESERSSSESTSENGVHNVEGRKRNSEDKRPGKTTPENST